MRIVNGLDQNTEEWKKYRNLGIGASDAPSLMNESPYGTPFSLWAEKAGLLKREEPNIYALQAMERGKKLEEPARELFEKKMGMRFPALNVMDDEHDFIKASLDGWNAGIKKFIEIKCASRVEHQKTLKESLKPNGKVTDKYRAQIQQQSLITGTGGFFVSYYPNFPGGEELAVVEVIPDVEYQQTLRTELIHFWHLVQTKTPPKVEATDLARVVRQLTLLQKNISGAFEALTLLSGAFEAQAK